jgi:hypothetical protein
MVLWSKKIMVLNKERKGVVSARTRRLERLVSLQHFERGMERTKDIDKIVVGIPELV